MGGRAPYPNRAATARECAVEMSGFRSIRRVKSENVVVAIVKTRVNVCTINYYRLSQMNASQMEGYLDT